MLVWKNITFPANEYLEFFKSQQQWKQSNQPYFVLNTWAPDTSENNFAFSTMNMPQIMRITLPRLEVNIATFILVRDDKSCLNCLLKCLLLIFEDEVESEWTEKFEL